MTASPGPAPRYQAIATDLAAKIRGGEYPPGEALPPQRELSAAYGVTLMTLRQALRRLSDDGLIVQQPGRGTFVAPPHLAYELGSLHSFADDLVRQGHAVRTTVLARSVRRASGRAAAQLRIAPGESALRLERLREFAGRPAIHQVSWVRQPHADRLRGRDFTAESLYGALADIGVSVARAAETVHPGLLDSVVAPLLKEPAGSAVFVSDRITYAVDTSAVVVDRATILGSMMEIRTERAVTGLSLRWGATG
ncbi:GntR family transcriptional regulator [Micromonospora sp. Llam0]|uniref:GntR family transcriptional regulator n=1 Tax=Micromonospora sp. Llam0 TaxID=2485143 RepID=UPI000F49C37D|nr:GntR family transcriptional regulator [Micromonospora sp. Llam0]ROO59227.1 GntR family transcriptional regulator [Micromonospora sp. Llam0]